MTGPRGACSRLCEDECYESHPVGATEERQHDLKKVWSRGFTRPWPRTVGEPPDHHRVDDGHLIQPSSARTSGLASRQGRTEIRREVSGMQSW